MRNRNDRLLLEIDNLDVSYDNRAILSGVYLQVGAGEIVTLIGTNGSGKSTLLKTVAGIIRPGHGKVMLDSKDITGKEPHELAHMGIASLMQGSVIFPSLTIMEHLQLASQFPDKINPGERAEMIWDTFPTLSAIRQRRAGLLSGGERQMLGFAMVLLREAKLWLLDEPSGGLAPETARGLMDCIRKQSKTRGVSILLAEQNLNEALRISDRLYILKNGATFSLDTHEVQGRGKLEEVLFGNPKRS